MLKSVLFFRIYNSSRVSVDTKTTDNQKSDIFKWGNFGTTGYHVFCAAFLCSLCDTALPCRACCINCVNCVGWDWEINHGTRWCRGFMSPSPIPSPRGIPLIFSSAQIRLYCRSFGCYCHRSVSESNSSRLIWSYFHMQDLAGGWWLCGWRWIYPEKLL